MWAIPHRKHKSLNCLQQKTLALSVTTDVGVPNAEKYHLSRQSNTAWDEIFLTGKKETNFDNESTTTNIEIFPGLERVTGPTKSINNLSIGLKHGLAACIVTRASCAGFALWQRSHLRTYLKTYDGILGHQKLVVIFAKILRAPRCLDIAKSC